MHLFLRLFRRLFPDRSPVRLLWHFGKAFFAAVRYGFPARSLTVIGITGTDGKTTTVHMVGHLLHEAGRKVGVLSTIATVINGQSEPNRTQKTSVNPFLLQQTLRRMVRAGCEFAVVEVSSHGLVQGRVHHIFPDVAAVTNVSPEHLDYHKTMEQYIRDKGKLFRMLHGRGVKVLNAGDASFDVYYKIPSAETIVWEGDCRRDSLPAFAQATAGTQRSPTAIQADFSLTNATSNEQGSHALLHTALGGEVELRLNVPGLFNLENALTAIGCAEAVGIPLALSLQSLASFSGVPGRLEEVIAGQDFHVFVDFTVTTAAYRKTLTTLRSLISGNGRLLTLAGACGNRMREKRPELGAVCSELSDVLILTSDETYGEPHEQIIAEIRSGVVPDQVDLHVIPDRREAIRTILRKARKGDVVAICGMAGVMTMMTATGQIPWDEREIVRGELLKEAGD